MPNIVMTKLKNQPTDKLVKAKIYDFLDKLADDDTAPGLHIEKMNQAVDSRARTARIDQSWRAVIYQLETKDRERTWVYAGAWEHDEAIRRAKSLKVDLNAVNGAVQLIAETMPEPAASIASPAFDAGSVAPSKQRTSFLAGFNYSRSNLVDELGFDQAVAEALLAATSEDEVLSLAEAFENAWEQNAGLSLASGESVDKIRADLGLEAHPDDDQASDDEKILRALGSPASKMQFTFVDDDEELRRIIDGGDFGAWRVFLHPEQQRYATNDYNGPFRLSGGAGTGKTVVLLHRARHLALANPAASVVLTTYTRALAENLKRDLERLDPELTLATELGEPGILIRGVDQLAASVRSRAGSAFRDAAAEVFGAPIESVSTVTSNADGWTDALGDADPDLPDGLKNESFFEGEYLQVVLPARLSSQDDYNAVRRPGRGVALDRKKRIGVWETVDRYRKNARLSSSLSYAEVTEVGATWLESDGQDGRVMVDHLLVDEGQDLTPSQWKFLRALARPGKNDLFIAEDTHQRIYGHHVVLSRCGVAIVGRSRRLTLNYRTTAENLAYAMRVLEGGAYVDAEGKGEDVVGYHSSRRGPTPTTLACSSETELLEKVAGLIESWVADESVDPGSVAVLARSNDRAASVRDALNRRGIPANHIKSAQAGGDRVVTLTMHTAKGMEFSRVVLFDVSDGVVPNAWVLEKASPEEREDVMLRERSLLYVAASRARDALVVTWNGKPSPLLGTRG